MNSINSNANRRRAVAAAAAAGLLLLAGTLGAQTPFTVFADPVPRQVEKLYTAGLQYLAKSQTETGAWTDGQGAQPGVVGLAVLAFLAHGEDPNHGPYAEKIRRGLGFILTSQDKTTGYIGTSMYNHGFATLALAEAYGMVDDERLGPALTLAVKLLLDSQARNPYGAWRYNSAATDADTTVSGACAVALLAARNAGLEIPDEAIKKALEYYRSCQSPAGGFGYTSGNGGAGPATSAIGTLVYALARQKKTPVYKIASLYLTQVDAGGGDNARSNHYEYYYLYYASQAFFHSTPEQWEKWNKANLARLQGAQAADGSWSSSHGPVFSTAGALLSLALNYRFLPIYER